MIKGVSIMIHTHQTAPTQFVEANSIRFAYRRFGKTGGVPLVLSQHYIGTMDYWDPTVTDGLARDREVILFNNAGVSSSSGEVPTTFERMGADAIAFIKALGLKQVDLFGFSIGGMVVQEITLQAPDLVRRLIVDGTGPRGGQGMELVVQASRRLFGATYDPPEHVWLAVKFSPSAAGQAAGRDFLKRTHRRQVGRDPEVNDKVSPAQVEAIGKWGVQQKGSYDYLKTIKQPTLVVNGAGTRSRSQVDRRWHRSARRSGNGVADPGCRAALWRHLRSARGCLACGQIQSVRGRPGRGTGVPEAHAS